MPVGGGLTPLSLPLPTQRGQARAYMNAEQWVRLAFLIRNEFSTPKKVLAKEGGEPKTFATFAAPTIREWPAPATNIS